MKQHIARLVALLPGLLLAGPAAGATLPFTGSISIGIGNLSGISVAGSGVATVNGSGGGLHLSSFNLAAGVFAGAVTTPVFNAAPISGYALAGGVMTSVFMTGPMGSLTFSVQVPTGSFSNAAGSFAGLSGGPPGGGVMPLNGVFVWCLFGGGGGGGALGCGASPAANVVVPLSPVGVGGSVTATGVVPVTAFGAPWTIGTAMATSGTVPVTIMGFAHGPGSGTSTAAQASGVVSLVTPVSVQTALATIPIVAVFTRVTLHFVPEPTTMLLLGAGVVALGLMGRRMSKP